MRQFLEGLLRLASLAFAILVMMTIHFALDPGPARGIFDWIGGTLIVLLAMAGVQVLIDLIDWGTE